MSGIDIFFAVSLPSFAKYDLNNLFLSLPDRFQAFQVHSLGSEFFPITDDILK